MLSTMEPRLGSLPISRSLIPLVHPKQPSHFDSASSTSAVAGVPLGHQVKVKSWHDAATLYNSLLSKGLIIRVRA